MHLPTIFCNYFRILRGCGLDSLYIISANNLLGAEAVLNDQVGSQGSLVCSQAPDAEIVNLPVYIINWQDEVFLAPTGHTSNLRELKDLS